MTCPTCNGANQGRGCPACLDCTRRVVGLPPMEELDDRPIGTPESDGLFAVCCTVFLVFVTVATTAAVFLYAYRHFNP